MRNTNWLLIAMAAALTIEAAGSNTHAADAESARPSLRGHWLQRAKDKLGLTEDQVTRIRGELQGEKTALKDIFSRLHDSRLDLRQAIQAPDANESSVRSAAAKVGAVEADLAVERLKLYGRIAPILTSEQLEKLKEFRAKIDEFVDRAIERFGQRLNSE